MKSRVLIVDDSADVRLIMSLRLAKAGFEVMTAGDGVEALASLEQQRADCVLLDLMMPRMNGFEFLAVVQRAHVNPPPVFVVSQLDDPATRQRTQQLGAAALFTKTDALHGTFAAQLEERLRAVRSRPTSTRQSAGFTSASAAAA